MTNIEFVPFHRLSLLWLWAQTRPSTMVVMLTHVGTGYMVEVGSRA